MYAIVEISGQQFKVEKEQEIIVNRLKDKEGVDIEFNKVLLIENNGKITLGTPFIEGARISATVISHLKDKKVLVFHKKRRKGYSKLNGHRHFLSKIVIDDILEKGAVAVKKPKKEIIEKPEGKAEVKKEAKAKKTQVKEKAEKKEVKATAKSKTSAPKAKKETK